MAEKQQTQGTRDALFRFALSEDGMRLGVSRYFPPKGGKEASAELLRRQVEAAGVQLPVDMEAAELVARVARKTGEVKRTPLVHGIPAQDSAHARVVALGKFEFPVFPGDAFMRKYPAVEAKAGQTIDGRHLEPKENFKPEDIAVKAGDNVSYDAVQGAFVATVWGMPHFKDGVVSVNPTLHVSEDDLMVRGTVHHKNFKGAPVTPEQIEKELRDIGVAIDIDLEALKRMIRRAKIAGTPLFDQILVEGKEPVPGADGWFEYLVGNRQEAVEEDSSGRVDIRDRGTYPLADTGQIIGRLHEPTSGEGGIDIYGKTIPARGGKPLHVHLGENVLVHEDKVTFEAKTQGIVYMEKNVLSVTDCLIVRGDVDLTTGNIKVEHGSVKVLGNVLAGFSVEAPNHVVVLGSIESANVCAGGDVEVGAGILMPEGGEVVAGGNVVANYTTNATIKAGGNVTIANDITNSLIQAKGKLIAVKGKGHIQGGEIITAKGMDVNTIGSDLGIATFVIVRIEHEEDTELRQERVKIRKAVNKIDEALGKGSPEDILGRTPRDKRGKVMEVLKHRLTLVRRRKAINEELALLYLRRQEELAGIKIKVRSHIYPGSELRFGAKTFKVVNPTEAATVYWSDRERDIVLK